MATAKTKKVQTPIDERETFVSLQKSFAETEQSVEEKLKVLYELIKITGRVIVDSTHTRARYKQQAPKQQQHVMLDFS